MARPLPGRRLQRNLPSGADAAIDDLDRPDLDCRLVDGEVDLAPTSRDVAKRCPAGQWTRHLASPCSRACHLSPGRRMHAFAERAPSPRTSMPVPSTAPSRDHAPHDPTGRRAGHHAVMSREGTAGSAARPSPGGAVAPPAFSGGGTASSSPAPASPAPPASAGLRRNPWSGGAAGRTGLSPLSGHCCAMPCPPPGRVMRSTIPRGGSGQACLDRSVAVDRLRAALARRRRLPGHAGSNQTVSDPRLRNAAPSLGQFRVL